MPDKEIMALAGDDEDPSLLVPTSHDELGAPELGSNDTCAVDTCAIVNGSRSDSIVDVAPVVAPWRRGPASSHWG